MKTLAIAGTFDTKGEEFLYVKKLATDLGLKTCMINTGVFESKFSADVSNTEIASAAGYDIQAIARKKDRALATEVLATGMRILIPKLYAAGQFDGIISFGGSGGTSLVTPAMRELPIGVPKVMVSTMASGNVAQYVGTSDIVMMPSIVDVAGLNKISKTIFKNAILAIAGMLGVSGELSSEIVGNKPLIAASMFGVTTPCIDMAKRYLEDHGYEVLVFHATGTGGKTMEKLIDAGFFVGVLDLTTTEWCDELVGGVLAAGSHRCEAAIENEIPQVVSVGACDMVNFGPLSTVPEKFADRQFYQHNPTVTLMRTTVEENTAIGTKLAEKWNLAQTEMTVMLPEKGVSMIDAQGQPFAGVTERTALFNTLETDLTNPKVKVIRLPNNINDTVFAETAARELISLIK
ncbi:Tm-1-like ATP-binding domain-containing protein [Loigolactobacillus coryniformis]|uniref:Tm-1-like ATP-binding domain-containing protein n=1 Tax=Loigolactobacillus coryniformis TaxID=1610 RepID=UPI00345D2F5A